MARPLPPGIAHNVPLVLRNFLTLGAGEAAARGIHAVALLLLARRAGSAELGDYGYAVAITSYLLLLVQQGFDTLAISDAARSPRHVDRYLGGILALRLVVACVLVLCIALSGRGRLLLVISLSAITTAAAPRWAFIAIGRMLPAAIAVLIPQAAFLAGVCFGGVLTAAAALVSGEAAAALFLIIWLANTGHRVRPSFDSTLWRDLLKRGWPLTISLALGTMLYNFDVLVLGWLSTSRDIGLYLACYRFVTVFTPVLAALQMALLPSLAKLYPNVDAMRSNSVPVIRNTALVALLISLTVFSLARPLLTVAFRPEFAMAAPILRVLAWVLPVQAVRSILRQILFAAHRQKEDTRNTFIAVLVNVLLDFALVPHWGALGCAISTLCAESIFCAAAEWTVRRRVEVAA